MTAYIASLEKRSNPNAITARLAGKLLVVILALSVVMGLLMCGITKAFASPMIRSDIVVKSDHIKLGDVFDGLEQHADFVLAPAPQPGQELVWNSPTLLRIATAFNLPWRPASDEAVRIKRAGATIDTDTIRAVIRDHLAGDDAEAVYNVRFDGPAPEIAIAGDAAPQLSLVDFNMNPRGGTFSAIVRASIDGGAQQTLNLRGIAERMVRVPVLRSSLKDGQIIGARDIDYITMRAADMRPGAVLNPEDMIGATPRHPINAATVIRTDDLEMPRMVSRGDLVVMVFNQNGMTLTAKGKALEDGAMNDNIKVSNISSNRTIEARVTNNKEVTVSQ